MARVDALPGPPSVIYAQPSPDKLVKFANKRLTNMPYRNLLLHGGSYGTVCGGLELNAALNESRTHSQRLLGQQAAPGLAGSASGTGNPSLLLRLTLLPASSAAASRPANLGAAARPWRAALRAAAAEQPGRHPAPSRHRSRQGRPGPRLHRSRAADDRRSARGDHLDGGVAWAKALMEQASSQRAARRCVGSQMMLLGLLYPMPASARSTSQ